MYQVCLNIESLADISEFRRVA